VSIAENGIVKGAVYVNGHCGEKVSHILEISGAVGGEMASADETISFTSQQKSMVVGIFGVVFEETQIYNNGTQCNYTMTITIEIEGDQQQCLIISVGEEYYVCTNLLSSPLSLESSPDGDLLILTNVSVSWYGSNVTLSCPDCHNTDLVTLPMNTTTGNFVIPLAKVFSSTSDELIVAVTVTNTCGEIWNGTLEIGSTSEGTTTMDEPPRDSGHATSVTPLFSRVCVIIALSICNM
jgi:hypothetical protein